MQCHDQTASLVSGDLLALRVLFAPKTRKTIPNLPRLHLYEHHAPALSAASLNSARGSDLRIHSLLSKQFTISIDAMGGDDAPDMVVRGIELLVERDEHVRFLLYGHEQKLRPLLDRYKRAARAVEIRDTLDVVGSGEKPTVALRTGRKSSMRRAIDAVASGEAAAVVSAGKHRGL